MGVPSFDTFRSLKDVLVILPSQNPNHVVIWEKLGNIPQLIILSVVLPISILKDQIVPDYR